VNSIDLDIGKGARFFAARRCKNELELIYVKRNSYKLLAISNEFPPCDRLRAGNTSEKEQYEKHPPAS
jgi:hypothetical protein